MLVTLKDSVAHVQDNQSNGDGVKHAQYGDGENYNIVQAYVGNAEAEQADNGNEALVGNFAIGQLGEVIGNCSGKTNAGSDAGKENDKS